MPINCIFILFSLGKATLTDILLKTEVSNVQNYECISNKKLSIKRFYIILTSCLVAIIFIFIQPRKLCIEEIYEDQIYLFTKNKPMSDEEVLKLIIRYDENKICDVSITIDMQIKERYYFSSQYEYGSLFGTVKRTINGKDEKEDLPLHCISYESTDNTPITISVMYNLEENVRTYTFKSEIVKLPIK